MKKYYKLVNRINGKLFSAVMSKYNNGVLCREYEKNKWVFPSKVAKKNGYLLTCFKSMADLHSYWRAHANNHEVWECEIGIELNELPPQFCYIGLRSKHLIQKSGDNWPTGTVMTDKIKLIRRVK